MDGSSEDVAKLSAQVAEVLKHQSLQDSGEVATSLWSLQAGIFVLLMQVGFTLVEAGTVQKKNTRNITVKNVLDVCISTAAFWSMGYAFAYGRGSKVLGWSYAPAGAHAFFAARQRIRWFFAWTFAATSATIVSGAVAERTKFQAYLVYSFVVSAIVYPVVVHLMWSFDGLLSPFANQHILGTDGFLDNAGGVVVHVTGGITGLIGAWWVGPRIGRFDIDGRPLELKPYSPVFTGAGVLILWVGYYGFTTGAVSFRTQTADEWVHTIATVCVNTSITAATAGITAFAYAARFEKMPTSMTTFNGVLGGLVASCATSNLIPSWAAIIVGFFAGVAYCFGMQLLLRVHLDDPLNASVVHGGCGIVGGLCVGLFATREGIRGTYGIAHPHTCGLTSCGEFSLLGMQVLGILLVLAWVGVAANVIFGVLHATGNLRTKRYEEELGLDVPYRKSAVNTFLTRQRSTAKNWTQKLARRRHRLLSGSFWQRKWGRVFKGTAIVDTSEAFQAVMKKTPLGEYILASYGANFLMEDALQIEAGPGRVFLGVYDGHGGVEAAVFVKENLHKLITAEVSQGFGVGEALKRAFLATDQGWKEAVESSFEEEPHLATVGACIVAFYLTREGMIYTASLGDSRVVLGSLGEDGEVVAPVVLSHTHNVNNVEHRKEYMAEHADDPSAVCESPQGGWRVKGKLQVTRTIGDLYMKDVTFNSDPLFPRFRCPEPYHPPYISAEPTVQSRQLQPQDRFVIVASDGLWEHVSDQEAVDLVHRTKRVNAARLLVRLAVQRAARKSQVSYEELIQIPRGVRRQFHDDITVIVFFLHGSKKKFDLSGRGRTFFQDSASALSVSKEETMAQELKKLLQAEMARDQEGHDRSANGSASSGIAPAGPDDKV